MTDILKDWRSECGFSRSEKDLRIYYTPVAFAKTIILVASHPKEIGWNMVIKPYKEGYRVEDIVVYPQKVSPAYVSVDLARYGMWKANLPDEIDQNLFGNGHSHVNMGTFSSAVDERQQHDEIMTKKNGFYFFQIWNKRNNVNSFFYDIDNMIYYPVEKIELIVEETEEFIEDSFMTVDSTNKYEAGEDFESEQII